MIDTPVLVVFFAALVTAIATGLGALPLLAVKHLSPRVLALANAAAAGLMLAACYGLIVEGFAFDGRRTLAGIVAGLVFIVAAGRLLHRHENVSVAEVTGADAKRILLIVGIMTLHSAAEGVGVGVAYGGGRTLGDFITAAIALHNVPEGLAISLVMVPRGATVVRAAGWSIFSSLPQPLLAVPAFLFVLVFQPWLPVGLGLAAGAMFWMVFAELIPEANEEAQPETVGIVVTLSFALMLGVQTLLEA
ncbi:MAG: ZIP family metal transporter [Alphaproteobacteria bacterium]|jgi:zinc transporter ZupT|nr:ZIP family metal transporter [Alphaproteobacteria bacterium]